MPMATEHHTLKPPCAASTTPPRFPLDLRAINNAAADVWDIRRGMTRILSDFDADLPNMPAGDLARCGVMVRKLETIIAGSVGVRS